MASIASQPLASVIVRTMGRPTLSRTLQSIAKQTWRPLEIVLVDAARQGLALTQFEGVPVVLVTPENGARAHAANAGLKAARGEWLLFLDEDDEWTPDHVTSLLHAATKAGAPVAYSQTLLVDAAGQAGRIFGGPFHRAALMQSNYLAIHAVAFRRRFVELGCQFDASLPIFEDWDFWLQLSARATFAFTGQPTAIYHAEAGQSGAGAGTNLRREEALAVRERLMAKWKR